ncbi:MAG: RNA polymerase factor sigma-54 [Planctomycetes bacterium]|nr:RNA polymerase factor sigma-54 [Planctomycetota bacterium]
MEQGLALLPSMLQSIEVLQLTAADLLGLIDRELQHNETLVAAPPAATEPGGRVTAVRDGPDGKRGFLESVAAPQPSLFEHLIEQLGWLDLSPEVVAGVRTLAERLDPRGLLVESDAELGAVVDAELLPRCIEVLQSLEPRGVGARDSIGAMLLQVHRTDPDFQDIAAMLSEHLEALARNKLPDVARALARPIEEVVALLQRIRSLDPRPGAAFAVDESGLDIRPDVIVRLVGERIEIELDSMTLPDLGISQRYQSMVSNRGTELEVRRYLRDKLRSARELIHAVEQRKRTLARVTLAVMQHQRAFLRDGRAAVRPLRMDVISEQLGLHPSTVSRAIAGKFAQTEHGVFRLRDFFDGERIAEGADGAGRMAVKEQVRALIAGEDPAAPLSDDEIVAQLAAKNVTVARRTVAKYRGELGLQSSWRRRRYPDMPGSTDGTRPRP